MQDIAKIIDHTYLKANATEDSIRRICAEAKHFGFRGVCINPKWVEFAKKELSGTDIKVVVVIDWPNGASTTAARVLAAEEAKKDGADEIDPVLGVGSVKMGEYDDVSRDLRSLAEVLPTKIIIETGYLTDEEIAKVSVIAKEAGCACVKTSTGMDPKVAIPEKARHIKIMRKALGEGFPIKAAGGIRTPEDAKMVIEAGATIIGASDSLAIIGKEGETDWVE